MHIRCFDFFQPKNVLSTLLGSSIEFFFLILIFLAGSFLPFALKNFFGVVHSLFVVCCSWFMVRCLRAVSSYSADDVQRLVEVEAAEASELRRVRDHLTAAEHQVREEMSRLRQVSGRVRWWWWWLRECQEDKSQL